MNVRKQGSVSSELSCSRHAPKCIERAWSNLGRVPRDGARAAFCSATTHHRSGGPMGHPERCLCTLCIACGTDATASGPCSALFSEAKQNPTCFFLQRSQMRAHTSVALISRGAATQGRGTGGNKLDCVAHWKQTLCAHRLILLHSLFPFFPSHVSLVCSGAA